MPVILYLEQFFRLPEEPGITQPYDFAQALAAAGHTVYMIAGRNQPTATHMQREGFEIYSLPVYYQQSWGFVRRMFAYLKYAWKTIGTCTTLIKTHKGEKIYVFAASPPLTIAFTGAYLKKKWGVPYVFEVQDLWPEFPIQAGAIRNPFLIKWLYKWETKIYKDSAGVLALSPGQAAGVKKAVAALPISQQPPIHWLPNFSDTRIFYPRAFTPSQRAAFLQEGELGVVYFGAIGRANHVDYFMEIAALAAEQSLPIRFFVVGEGSEKARLLHTYQHLQNLHFLSAIPKHSLPEFLTLMDVAYVCFGNLPILQTNSPNKLFDSLAMGLAVIVNQIGWMREIVEIHHCGAYCPPETPQYCVELLQAYHQTPTQLALHKKNARIAGETHFSREKICAEFVAWMEEVMV